MKMYFNSLITLSFILFAHSAWTQADCPILLTPGDGAIDQELTITFTWEAAPTGEAPTNYLFFAGETSGNLTQLYSGATTSATISSFFDLETTYYWSVVAEAPGGNSSGCVEYSFTTIGIPQPTGVNCGASTPVSISEDMESPATGWTGDIGAGTSNELWNNRTGKTPSGGSGNTGPNGAYSGSNYFYYEASGSSESSADVSLISPALDLTLASGTVDLSFYMFAYGTGIHSLEVGIGTNSTGPFTNIWSWDGPLQTSQTDPWQLVGFDVGAYAGQTIYVEFKHVATATGGFLGDLAVDLLKIDGCEAPVAPNDICATAAVLASSGQPGSLTGQSTEFATDSGLGAATCGLASPTKDVYYSIETDIDGGGLDVTITSTPSAKYTIVLYENACGSLAELACQTAVSTGSNVTLSYFVPDEFTGKGGSTNRSVPQNLTVRVFDENNADELFDIDASGSSLAALPVQLTSWKATLNNKYVSLDWITEQEFNTEKFVIEKSLDGSNWFDIARVNAVGYSVSTLNYSYEDYDLSSTQMYRLRIVDFDGYTEYSGIINITRDDLDFKVFPNPVFNELNIQLEGGLENANIEIYNMQGQLVLADSDKIIQGQTLLVNQLPNGVYSLRVTKSNSIYQTNFIKN